MYLLQIDYEKKHGPRLISISSCYTNKNNKVFKTVS